MFSPYLLVVVAGSILRQSPYGKGGGKRGYGRPGRQNHQRSLGNVSIGPKPRQPPNRIASLIFRRHQAVTTRFALSVINTFVGKEQQRLSAVAPSRRPAPGSNSCFGAKSNTNTSYAALDTVLICRCDTYCTVKTRLVSQTSSTSNIPKPMATRG